MTIDKEEVESHANALFVCFGGLFNTGYLAPLGSIEVVRNVALKKASAVFLAALANGERPIVAKTEAAK